MPVGSGLCVAREPRLPRVTYRNKHELQTSSFLKLAPVAESCQEKNGVNRKKAAGTRQRPPSLKSITIAAADAQGAASTHAWIVSHPHGSHELAPYRQRATPLCLANTAPRMEICRSRGPGLLNRPLGSRTDRRGSDSPARPTQLADSMSFSSNSEPRTAVSPRSKPCQAEEAATLEAGVPK